MRDTLTGPTQTLIIDLDISDENYAKCWQILDKKYGNDLETRAQLIDKILNCNWNDAPIHKITENFAQRMVSMNRLKSIDKINVYNDGRNRV